MPEVPNPYEAPDTSRIPRLTDRSAFPEDIGATFTGTGKSGETWQLSLGAERAYFTLGGSDEQFSMSREEVGGELAIGFVSGKRATLVVKQPRTRRLSFELEALNFVYNWLGPEAVPLRQRILRNGWAMNAAIGAMYLGGLGSVEQSVSNAAIGALLIASAAVARFTTSPATLLLGALGWLAFGASFVVSVVGGASPWLLVVVAALLVGIPRSLILYWFFSQVPKPPSSP